MDVNADANIKAGADANANSWASAISFPVL